MDDSVRENTGRPCKACFSWEDMLKFTKKSKEKLTKDSTELNNKEEETKTNWNARRKQQQQQMIKHRREDCPLDKDQLGRCKKIFFFEILLILGEKEEDNEESDFFK